MIALVAKRAFAQIGLEIRRSRSESDAKISPASAIKWAAALAVDPTTKAFLELVDNSVEISNSQIMQDVFALFVHGNTAGFFVEFGAADGVSFSNSYLLEKKFGWSGILAEPGRRRHRSLFANRPNARVDTRCVWRTSGESLTFVEPKIADLSTIGEFRLRDLYSAQREAGDTYQVETVSLSDLLRCHDAPHSFDYLSMDTEGSEFAILENFDFAEFRPKVATVEHNHTKDRQRILKLFAANGYTRVFEELSLFDDWYVDATTWQRVVQRFA